MLPTKFLSSQDHYLLCTLLTPSILTYFLSAMAKTLQLNLASSSSYSSFFFFILFLFTTLSATSAAFSQILSPATLGLKREKLSHLHFYFHDIVGGSDPTAVRVAEAHMTNTSPTGFGAVVMIDDPLTVGPEPNSKLVGRAQGVYASASQDELGLLMVMDLAFMEGKYNGSSLSLLGRNAVLSTVREMPIVGGSGLFRFARGYAQARTHVFDFKTGNAVVEYNVYVFHY